MNETLYSLRMHASRGGEHLSGAEELTTQPHLETLAAALVRRALGHPRGAAESIQITVEAVDAGRVRRGVLPDLRTLSVTDFRQGRKAAAALLETAGISALAATAAITALEKGASPSGKSMRGAMLIDATSGKRLEPDASRGVRASRMGLTPGAAALLRERLSARGLDNPHVREALVLAAKVLSVPGIAAELCWSDDPDYTAGYVAALQLGYVRLTHLKPVGEERGGRAFFVRPGHGDINGIIEQLERSPLLIDEIGAIGGSAPWKEER
ncbi:6-carboxyhexanoate-CoA ligase [Desulfuromonas soudanensis]|uniref:6-carboxyhexanoate--CoA ligase n=1 Tax=Desulfuromonas soudanensis TaxID=1603606 RepID=A0A0M4D1X2_9BACT|nr:6-carboxyhexanoate--CoA ligase [Desulfuromonas soudanensis]ALC16201.1 6-carboxyhexanoate-CoA ligase [Desulfuromonas soudanensis]